MRDLDTDVLNALNDDQISIAVLGEFDFVSGVERLWAGPEGYVLEWDSETWTSLADLGQIDKISEAQGLSDSRTRISLRVNSETVSEIGADDSRGRPATLTLLLLDPDGDPIGPVHFKKTMGGVSITAEAAKDEDGETVVSESISMELLDETATLGRNHFVRMTYEQGRRIDPNDHGLEWVADPSAINLGPVRTGGFTLPPEFNPYQ